MKIWIGYSSEHSSKIVLVGHFTSKDDAGAFKKEFDRLVKLVQVNYNKFDEANDVYPNEIMRSLFKDKYQFASLLSPKDLIELGCDFDARVAGNNFVLTSDEYDLGVVIKMLLMAEAKIEILSEHTHKDDCKQYLQ